ncbi:MAG TPA: GNAT family N-acetyltransferase [Paucimonas sp.]|nr:GNAT family N-acetyltransferase [Paucimonas sp.]
MDKAELSFPAPNATVSLREITADTLRSILDLSVSAEQTMYVASNAVSIAQAYFYREAWFRAIHADEVPVGFVMLKDDSLVPDNSNPGPIEMWRFMIDHRYQGMGFGRAAIALIARHVRERTGQSALDTSYMPGPHSPEAFYLRCGFLHTGRMDGDEIVLSLSID